MKAAIRITAILLIASFVSGCSSFYNNRVNKIQVVADSKANYDSVTDVDFVFIYEDDSELKLPETNEKWFDVHNDLRFNRTVRVVSMRIPPSLISEVQMPAKHFMATKILAYINFKKNEDQAPIDLTRNHNPVLMLKDDHYLISRRR